MTTGTVLVQLCAKPTRVDAFLAIIDREYFVTECVRSGVVGVPRAAVSVDVNDGEKGSEVEGDKSGQVDATQLPPG